MSCVDLTLVWLAERHLTATAILLVVRASIVVISFGGAGSGGPVGRVGASLLNRLQMHSSLSGAWTERDLAQNGRGGVHIPPNCWPFQEKAVSLSLSLGLPLLE